MPVEKLNTYLEVLLNTKKAKSKPKEQLIHLRYISNTCFCSEFLPKLTKVAITYAIL